MAADTRSARRPSASPRVKQQAKRFWVFVNLNRGFTIYRRPASAIPSPARIAGGGPSVFLVQLRTAAAPDRCCPSPARSVMDQRISNGTHFQRGAGQQRPPSRGTPKHGRSFPPPENGRSLFPPAERRITPSHPSAVFGRCDFRPATNVSDNSLAREGPYSVSSAVRVPVFRLAKVDGYRYWFVHQRGGLRIKVGRTHRSMTPGFFVNSGRLPRRLIKSRQLGVCGTP